MDTATLQDALDRAVSVLHQVPPGGEDLARYAGAPRLVCATGEEAFDTVADVRTTRRLIAPSDGD